MLRKTYLLLLILCVAPLLLTAQQKSITGRIFDAHTKETLPFAIIKTGSNGTGIVADMDGKFIIPGETPQNTQLEVSYLGYRSIFFPVPAHDTDIYLPPLANTLGEVVVRSPDDKIRRIINTAIANKAINDPDKYDWYQCHVYYKMVVNASLPDSTLRRLADTRDELNEFLKDKHLLMSETYSVRTWHRVQQLQEDVLASRFSGLKKSMFTSLVTDVLPFHAYTDYINLNGKDYHNPVSNGFEEYYRFSLQDEITEGKDTVWILSFKPRARRSGELSGSVYINSDGYAISRIIAQATDTILKRTVRIEQQYEQVKYGTTTRWFPDHLNYIIDWQWQNKKKTFIFHMKGTSGIDSVNFDEHPGFKFDKAHTVRMAPHADEVSDSGWARINAAQLDARERRTYHIMDSIGEKEGLDQKMNYISKLPEGKLPIGCLYIDLLRLFSANNYENIRAGLGVQTNEHVIKWFSVGGWAGYGFADEHWKYGLFADAYADKYKEFVFRGGYYNDISDPGRVHIDPDLDKNYLASYLLQRVDKVKAYTFSVKKKLGYLSFDLSATQQQIIPLYKYALLYDGADLTSFTTQEASLRFRYAYAERTAPFFSHYNKLGSRYPVWYGKLTTGILTSSNLTTPYTQALTAVLWHKHINRIGFEHILLEGGKSWSNGNLPLSKLFAGNGFYYSSNTFIPESIYTFGGMMTIYPYQYYSDQFVNFIYRHDFDWKLYRILFKNSSFSSAPNLCVQYNLLYGSMQHPEAQQYVNFSIPNQPYNEAGVLLNNFIRLNYLNVYYLTFNIGYFYHPDGPLDPAANGRLVFSVGAEF